MHSRLPSSFLPDIFPIQEVIHRFAACEMSLSHGMDVAQAQALALLHSLQFPKSSHASLHQQSI